MNTLHIKNGRIIDPKSGMDAVADIVIANGKIVALGKNPQGFDDSPIIDAENCIVCPGLVDLSAHLNPLENELTAAVAGGITTLAIPPDTSPPLDEPGLVERLVRQSERAGLARVLPIGALTQQMAGEKLAEMVRLHDAGCVAFSQSTKPVFNTWILLRAMQYAATFDYSIFLNPEEHYLSQGGVAHDGEVASRLGLSAIPVSSETIAIATAIHLASETGVRLHLSHLSSAAGIDMVYEARQKGLKISCDVAIHHLHLTEESIGYFDSYARLTPPLRGAGDRHHLRQAVAEGIAVLCSDHKPVDEDEKQLPFAEATPGAIGLELLLPLTLKWANEDKIPLVEALARITSDAAAILGVPHGSLSVGKTADLCIFNPEEIWVVTPENLYSKGRNTPFLNHELTGRVCATLVDGRVVYKRSALLSL